MFRQALQDDTDKSQNFLLCYRDRVRGIKNITRVVRNIPERKYWKTAVQAKHVIVFFQLQIKEKQRKVPKTTLHLSILTGPKTDGLQLRRQKLFAISLENKIQSTKPYNESNSIVFELRVPWAKHLENEFYFIRVLKIV